MAARNRFLGAGLALAACIALNFSINNLSEDAALAVDRSTNQLGFDFVSEAVESELDCDLFIECLHIELINSAQCKTNVLVDLGFEDKFGQQIGGGELIVPSPGFTGGLVIEIGSNRYENIDTSSLLAY